jgi:hypothetical protein
MTDPPGNDDNEASSPAQPDGAKPQRRSLADTLPESPRSKHFSDTPVPAPGRAEYKAEYVAAKAPPAPTRHRTIELDPVKVSPEVDPRRALTEPSLARRDSADEPSQPLLLQSKQRRRAPASSHPAPAGDSDSLALHGADSGPPRDAPVARAIEDMLGTARWLFIAAAVVLVLSSAAVGLSLLAEPRQPAGAEPAKGE